VTAGACRRLGAVLLAVAAAAALAAAACGKRGNPLPPLRSVPARIADLAAHRVDDRVELTWTVPAANTDGTTPPAMTGFEIYAASTDVSDPVPAPTALLVRDRLLTRVAIRADDRPATAAGSTDTRPAPGERTRVTESVVELPKVAVAGVRHYIVIPVSGEGRGRPEAQSDVVSVPLPAAALPDPPKDLSATFTETTLTLRWQPGGASHTFRVLGSGQVFAAAAAQVLTPKPVTGAEFTLPVEFGRERCFVVRTLAITGKVTLESAPGDPVCVTPVDRFAPPVPANLQAIQEGTAVILIWTAVEANDLAGYIVLRGDGAGENMQPLVSAPVESTTYRDTTARPDATYVYAVYAQDKATPPNISQLSNRQTVMVR
jgi:hypothetical protein